MSKKQVPPKVPMRVRPSKASGAKKPGTKTSTYASKSQCSHRGNPVRVGPYTLYPAGTRYLDFEDFGQVDIIIPLEPKVPELRLPRTGALGVEISVSMPTILTCPWRDFGPPPDGFEEFLLEHVIPALEAGKRIMPYCIGSHGRTGTFLASLIALLEPWEETPDPVQAVRERHCSHAVETWQQADFVFELLDVDTPEKYEEEFRSRGRGGGGFVHHLHTQGAVVHTTGSTAATEVDAGSGVGDIPFAVLQEFGVLDDGELRELAALEARERADASADPFDTDPIGLLEPKQPEANQRIVNLNVSATGAPSDETEQPNLWDLLDEPPETEAELEAWMARGLDTSGDPE